MGDKLRTIQNLEIIKSDPENNLIFIKGSIPGSKNSFVLIQKPSKLINKKTTLEKFAKMQKEEVKVSEKKETKPKDKKAESTESLKKEVKKKDEKK